MQADADNPYAAPRASEKIERRRSSWPTTFAAVVASLAVFAVTTSLLTGILAVGVFYLSSAVHQPGSNELLRLGALLASVVGAVAAIAEFNRVRRKAK
jgi:hypothetical protein